MATVLLQTVGAAIGGAVAGPIGALVGRAAGAVAGNAIDHKLFSKDHVITGPRLDQMHLQTSTEGTSVPRVYGRARFAGQLMWATRFEEVASTKKSSGKGGGGPSTSTTTFSYYGNFAVALCEGPVSGIRRIWADGQELDLTKIEFRFYPGSDDQPVDPLIEAKQGIDNAPAYRGTAYVVFDSFPLAKYGNRIPQLSFEVLNSVGKLEQEIRSISVIPGATEYGYDTGVISSGGGSEAFNAYNRHNSLAETDWEASIDELQMLCPNLESVSLVVTWYGDDLRAGNCNIEPGVTHLYNVPWEVSGLKRHEVHLVSQVDGKPAYGGTPSDGSVLRAIADLKSRGLKVTLNPFLMMDIPQQNDLPWIDAQNSQPAYPWRGEISCFPPPGAAGTVDKTAMADTQVATFSAKYALMIRHYAQLCNQAGGVDGFLIGSELAGLTKVRDENGDFPFVGSLVDIATEARSILGSQCLITYGADWSEYFGYHPNDGSGDVLFNLDLLWSCPAIDAVGIDNYMPLTDWRGDGDPAYPSLRSAYSKSYQKQNIAGGEGFDWYYATPDDRKDRVRTPITDGDGEPWVFRYKDLVAWWSNQHHDRTLGMRNSQPTSWIPESKPIVFTELGCPAIDLGSNQPNVFVDLKSAQSSTPYFSSGTRDDLIQRRFLESHFEYWKDPENNPDSGIYNGSMLDINRITPWAWDARPFPWFPIDIQSWSDGENWHEGHWLNGRLGGLSASDLIAQILKEYGVEEFSIDVDAVLDGYVSPGSISAREVLEPLIELLGINVSEQDGVLIFRDNPNAPIHTIPSSDVVFDIDRPKEIRRRTSETELPVEVIVHHTSVFSEYEETVSKSKRIAGEGNRKVTIRVPVTMSGSRGEAVANAYLKRQRKSRDELQLSVPRKHLEITDGDIVKMSGDEKNSWLVKRNEIEEVHNLLLQAVDGYHGISHSSGVETGKISEPETFGKPRVLLMDLPLLPGGNEAELITHISLDADPWGREYNVFTSPAAENFILRTTVSQRGKIGTLLSSFGTGVSGRWDYSNELHIDMRFGSFETLDPIHVLGGANLIAVKSILDSFEIVQFRSAELQPDGSWVLRGLLRGQLGTEIEALSGAAVGSSVVVLDTGLFSTTIDPSERGIELNWRTGPADLPNSSDSYEQSAFTYTGRSRKMLAPVHLRSEKQSNGDIHFAWVRRARINADNWENGEVPLDAGREEYDVKILDSESNVVRNLTAILPGFNYSASEQMGDFGATATEFRCVVAQLGDNGLPGASTEIQQFTG